MDLVRELCNGWPPLRERVREKGCFKEGGRGPWPGSDDGLTLEITVVGKSWGPLGPHRAKMKTRYVTPLHVMSKIIRLRGFAFTFRGVE